MDIVKSIEKHLKKTFIDNDIVLYSIRYYEEGGTNYLQILIDDNVKKYSLDEIVEISEKISSSLDRFNLIEEHYLLDVSTPGIYPPLHTLEHYKNAIGCMISIELEDCLIECRLKEVEDDHIEVEENGKKNIISFKEIKSAQKLGGIRK